MKRKVAIQVLNENKKVYEKIAKSFSATRSFVWPELQAISSYLQEGEKVLDLGCGNGRLYPLLAKKKIKYVGIDSSQKLIEIAQKQHTKGKFLVGDALKLPLPDRSFDAVLSIAVLHHIPGREFRIQFLKEAARVLKPKGKIILTVWNLWQIKYLKLLVKFSLLKIIGKNKLDWRDVQIPWQKRYLRYYHFFLARELKKLLLATGFRPQLLTYLKRRGHKTNLLVVGIKN